MAHYTNTEELRELIEQYRKDKILTERLQHIIRLITAGLVMHFKYSYPLDDLYQEMYLWFLQKQDKIDLSKNVFCYLTTCINNTIRQFLRGRLRDAALVARLKEKQMDQAKD